MGHLSLSSMVAAKFWLKKSIWKKEMRGKFHRLRHMRPESEKGAHVRSTTYQLKPLLKGKYKCLVTVENISHSLVATWVDEYFTLQVSGR